MEDKTKHLLELTAEECAMAENIYRRWKADHAQIESEIDQFMAGKADRIRKIMDRSDNLKVIYGTLHEVEPSATKPTDEVDGRSEEIRLLKEQNELLKRLLAKQLS